MKYLKLYKTLQEFEDAKGNLVKPYVAYIEDDKKLNYSSNDKPQPSINALKFTAVEDSTLKLNKLGSPSLVTLSASTDGVTWEEWDMNDISLTSGESVYIKGDNPSGFSKGTANCYNFVMTGKLNCEGNVMSLLGEDITEIPSEYCFTRLFYNCASLLTAPELLATTLSDSCYYYMFYNCVSLITAPELIATTLARSCYYGMFMGCTSLVNAPSILPATTLAETCYQGMFSGCTSLEMAPELQATTLADRCCGAMFYNCKSLAKAPSILPATILSNYCYYQMFLNCSSLTTAPELPATTLASYCYNQMFYGCKELNYIKALFTTIPSDSYTKNWMKNVASSGTFVKNTAAEWDVSGVNGIPEGWTVQTA